MARATSSAYKSAEERHQGDLRRVLLDVDRERTALAKLQRELEQLRRSAAEEVERHSARVQKLESELMQVRQKLSGAEAALTEARAAGDQLRAHHDKALTKPPRKVSAKKVKSLMVGEVRMRRDGDPTGANNLCRVKLHQNPHTQKIVAVTTF